MARIVIVLTLLYLCYAAAATAVLPGACKVRRGGTTAPLAARACGREVGNDDKLGHDLRRHEDQVLNEHILDSGHHIRTIYGNASVPWEDGEGVRIHVLSERENPQVVFKCSEMKEVCQNMCYGITCRELPDTLTKHSAGKEPDDARKRNKCGSKKPNRCSKDFGGTGKGPSGMSCDEYPFATTLEGQQDPSKSVTRCVPQRENSIQGGTLGVVKKYGDGTAFDVLFDFGAGPVRASSGGGVDYCKAKLHTDSVCQQTDTWQQNS